jgi:hemoglobin/transferrin/lactoferrin receptor protein
MFRSLGRAVLAAATLAPTLPAQAPDTSRKFVPLAAVTVTATRSERSTFDTPQPITVFDSTVLREKLPNGAADLFRDAAGLDVSGVGTNQRRPQIRGQRGQRILLLADGLRLNNARRQQDFGELPALADITAMERVEVVRGPSSVLYGTDAIGGVVNLISASAPRAAAGGNVHGAITYRYGSTGLASTPNATVTARFGRLGIRANASYREAEDYLAPKGSFGDITLNQDVLVRDSGVRDRSYRVGLGYDLTSTSELFARAEFYSAERAGFGWIDPAAYDPGSARIQITYPDQSYKRYSLGYRANALSAFFANRAEVTAYVQRNERQLVNDIFVPISPAASVVSQSFNFTDLNTVGGRLELARPVGPHLLTYGFDAFSDRSVNTDSSHSVTTGFGPTPTTRSSNRPSIPNATFRSAGLFAQLELNPTERLTAVIGSRAQDIFAETRATPNLDTPTVSGTDRTVVSTVNALYRVTENLNAIATLGQGFRSPNLVERFFEGAAPEGNGFQRSNASLAAETSVNADLGLRYRRGPLYAEGFVFRNDIENAIRIVATGDSVNARPAFQNRNVGKLRIDGLELTSGIRSSAGLDASVSFTRLDGTNVSQPGRPTGDSYSSKWVADAGYRRPSGRFSLGYTVRHQGEQKDVIIGTNPIGSVIPAFTVHSARASVRLFHRAGLTNRIALTVENIGDELYAEFPNASFFRPEPGRNISIALVTAF